MKNYDKGEDISLSIDSKIIKFAADLVLIWYWNLKHHQPHRSIQLDKWGYAVEACVINNMQYFQIILSFNHGKIIKYSIVAYIFRVH